MCDLFQYHHCVNPCRKTYSNNKPCVTSCSTTTVWTHAERHMPITQIVCDELQYHHCVDPSKKTYANNK